MGIEALAFTRFLQLCFAFAAGTSDLSLLIRHVHTKQARQSALFY